MLQNLKKYPRETNEDVLIKLIKEELNTDDSKSVDVLKDINNEKGGKNERKNNNRQSNGQNREFNSSEKTLD